MGIHQGLLTVALCLHKV
uniref:Uncharacterized protein n=1 Tax=Anguilla anguilla TaxID=7936 RepID=A0A0E9SCG7_ANGAN